MSQRHKHYDIIVAWAEGKPIQFRNGPDGWQDFPTGTTPIFCSDTLYRIKPEKKKGWVNIYKTSNNLGNSIGSLYKTKQEADAGATPRNRVACIEIEWKEE